MVRKIRHILFTSDLSAGSKHAFQYALGLATQYNARLSILHVIEEPPENIKTTLAGLLTQKQLADLERQNKGLALTTLVGKSMERRLIREGLQLFCRDAAIPTETDVPQDNVIITSGGIVDEILRQSRDLGCDLIVMGTHQRGFIGQAMLGGSVKGVLRQTGLPVFVAPIPKDLFDE